MRERCTEERKSMTILEDPSEVQQKDLSRVEDVVTKFSGIRTT